MNLHTLVLTNNACFQAGEKHVPHGIMMHSTGANNPNLKRYVGPDDGYLGKNRYNNHWNTKFPDGRAICAHAFIGKLNDGTVATYQTLPWDMVGWHSGSGKKGSANRMGYIGVEICEDNKHNLDYYNQCVDEFVDLCIMLCKHYNISPENITTHKDAHDMGIATNHGDPYNWSNILIKDGYDKVPTIVDIRRRVLEGMSDVPKKQINVFTRVYVGHYLFEFKAKNKLKEIQKSYPMAYITRTYLSNNRDSAYSIQLGAFADDAYAQLFIKTIPYNIRCDVFTERS